MLEPMGERVDLNGVSTWYDDVGEGDPVVLLHGGMSDSTGWGFQAPALAERYRVLTFDRRGHGKTPDTIAPFSYDAMADETVAFLETVVGGAARLVGWSDGGIVALLVSMRRPDLVPRQVLIGANFHHDGLLDAAELGDDPSSEHVAVYKMLYEANAIDPEHWPTFFAKTSAMWSREPTLVADDLRRVETPSLVMVGDDDMIALDHTVALYEALPAGQLAVVPGTSHVLTMEKPALVNQLIVDFLAESGAPGTLAPVRRS